MVSSVVERRGADVLEGFGEPPAAVFTGGPGAGSEVDEAAFDSVVASFAGADLGLCAVAEDVAVGEDGEAPGAGAVEVLHAERLVDRAAMSGVEALGPVGCLPYAGLRVGVCDDASYAVCVGQFQGSRGEPRLGVGRDLIEEDEAGDFEALGVGGEVAEGVGEDGGVHRDTENEDSDQSFGVSSRRPCVEADFEAAGGPTVAVVVCEDERTGLVVVGVADGVGVRGEASVTGAAPAMAAVEPPLARGGVVQVDRELLGQQHTS
ncbi:hypothetical protein AN218_16940 [Streptomyces nanshensis]|uniref:Uncharacterized protein n=1 Tax=Streptomyces nanshensis TaxID=518642 RepID=A0A1E7L2X5_9ACTN|nr:hypothetical protein AN218_16940 [Streptomyces nanshensis]